MRIVAISDLHGHLPEIPRCDICIIAGDICGHPGGRPGTFWDCRGQADWLGGPFRAWLDAVPADHVVATWGNHDFVGQRQPDLVPRDLRWTLLVDAGATVAGRRFWGSPWSPWFHDWAFNAPAGDAAETFLTGRWALVPDDTDVLVVHGPPAGYGDLTQDGRRTGSTSLAERIAAVRPKLSLHGHIHEGRGRWDVDGTTIANVSVLDVGYRLVHPAMAFEI